jgi:hypothetical protein
MVIVTLDNHPFYFNRHHVYKIKATDDYVWPDLYGKKCIRTYIQFCTVQNALSVQNACQHTKCMRNSISEVHQVHNFRKEDHLCIISHV